MLIPLILATALSLPVDAPPAGLGPHGVTISSSDTDPWATIAAPTFDVRTLYLWAFSPPEDSILFVDVVLIPTFPIIAVRPGPGFYYSPPGRIPNEALFTSTDACREAPVVAGEIDVLDDGGRICFVGYEPSELCVWTCEGKNLTSFLGYASDGSTPCQASDLYGCGPRPAVTPTTWGRMRSWYRMPG